MSKIDILKKMDEEDLKQTPKIIKVGVIAGTMGCLMAAQTTLLGRIATTIANPIINTACQGVVIGGTTVASGYLGYKFTGWLLDDGKSSSTEEIDAEMKKIKKEMAELR